MYLAEWTRDQNGAEGIREPTDAVRPPSTRCAGHCGILEVIEVER